MQEPGVKPQRDVHQLRVFDHRNPLALHLLQYIQNDSLFCRYSKFIHSPGFTQASGVTFLLQLWGDISTGVQQLPAGSFAISG
jgi:hypothetical protein